MYANKKYHFYQNPKNYTFFTKNHKMLNFVLLQELECQLWIHI